MQVLIISGGSIDTKYALAFLSKREYDYVIAVDKGALFCWENGIRAGSSDRGFRYTFFGNPEEMGGSGSSCAQVPTGEG